MVRGMEYKEKYGVTYTEWVALRSIIMFKQNYKCVGCGDPIGVKKRDKHMHHINGNPKDTYEANLMVLCPLDHWFANGFQLKQYKSKPIKMVKLDRFISGINKKV